MSERESEDTYQKLKQSAAKRRANRTFCKSNISEITDIPAMALDILPISPTESPVCSVKGAEKTTVCNTPFEVPQFLDVSIVESISVLPTKSLKMVLPLIHLKDEPVQNVGITPVSKFSSESTPLNKDRKESVYSGEVEENCKEARNPGSFEMLKTQKSGNNSVSPSPAKSASKVTTDNLKKMRQVVKIGVQEESTQGNKKARSKSLTEQGISAYENIIKEKIYEQFPEGIGGSVLEKSQSDQTEGNVYMQQASNKHAEEKAVEEFIAHHVDLRKPKGLERGNSKLMNIELADLKLPEAHKQESPKKELLYKKIIDSITGVHVYPKLVCLSLFTFLLECSIRDGNLLI